MLFYCNKFLEKVISKNIFNDICYMNYWDNLLSHLKYFIKRNPE